MSRGDTKAPIHIPKELREIIVEFTMRYIKEQPADVINYAAEYFLGLLEANKTGLSNEEPTSPYERAASKEKVTQKAENKEYIIDIPQDYEPDVLGLGNQIFHCMKKYRNAIAQYVADTGESETYNELLTRCVRVAIHLQARHLTKTDVIILCSYKQKESIVPFVASLFLAIPIASLDPNLSLMDVSYLLKEVTPKMLFVVPEVVEIIEASLAEINVEAEIVVFGESDKHTKFTSFLEPDPNEDNFIPVPTGSLDETAVIVFGSGITGLTKGIMLSHYGLQSQGNDLITSGNIGLVNLTYSTLYWITCIDLSIANFQIGAAAVLCKKFEPESFWQLIDNFKISTAFIDPSQVVAIIKAGRPDDVNTTSLRCCMIGAAPISEERLWELRAILPATLVFQMYGLSELCGAVTLFKTNKIQEKLYLQGKPNSVGTLVPGKYKVVELETEKTCGPYKQGELRVKSGKLMNGYYKRDSTEAFDKEGWLRTGDIVYYDNEKCFYVVDRIKDMLKFGLFHIPTAMLEQVIMSHPAVKQAVVVGIPHEEDGDHPMALITANTDEENIVEDILKFVEETVPDRMKLRGGVKILSELPSTPSGKIKKSNLREMVIKGEI